MTTTTTGRSSDIISELLGDTRKYVALMASWAKKLKQKYPNEQLKPFFDELPKHIISILPMAFYDSLVKDLGGKSDDDILAAIGLNLFLISTHDDIVDELPREREKVAGLIYSGNIAGLEGMRILFEKKEPAVAQALIKTINQNHYQQQIVVDLLWQGKKVNFTKYLEGIKHICIFSAIGPMCALASTGRTYLKNKITNFAKNYGFALQLVDDIREVEEDKIAGYTSYPLLEGIPYRESFKKLYQFSQEAGQALDSKWKRMGFYPTAISNLAQKLQKEISESR